MLSFYSYVPFNRLVVETASEVVIGKCTFLLEQLSFRNFFVRFDRFCLRNFGGPFFGGENRWQDASFGRCNSERYC